MAARRGAVVIFFLVALGSCSGTTAPTADTATTISAPRATSTSAVVRAMPVVTETPATTPPPATEAPVRPTPATTPPHVAAGYPPQPDGVAWPTDDWTTGQLPAGVDMATIDGVVDEQFGAADAPARVRSVLVVHEGRIVYERYHPLDGPDVVQPSWSVAKSVTATLVGMAVMDGLLDVAAPAPVPEWGADGDPRGEITLEHLLRMSSGLEWLERYEPDSDPWALLTAPHAADVAISKPLVAEPGTVFNYSTGTSAIVAEILADVLGGPDALDRYVRERLMEPLGIRSTQLLADSTGQFLGGVGFESTTRDFARFGLLHLRGGVWDRVRLLPAGWIDWTRLPTDTNPLYGAHWWLRFGDGSFSAEGLWGQLILIVPDRDLLVVATATEGGDSAAVARAVLDEFADTA